MQILPFNSDPAMQGTYLICLLLGGAVLVLQTAAGFLGWGDTLPGDGGDAAAGDGLDLLSVRTLAAGATLFGAVGLWLGGRGIPAVVTVPAALVAGSAAVVATAYITRQLLRLESDGTLHIENAVGQSGTVYLPVPAHRTGYGMVQFTLQGRTVELRAVADEETALPTGTSVIVISVMEGETVEVTPTPLIEGIDA